MATPPKRPYRTSVYFARCGKYAKIGFADNPEQRVRRLFNAGHLVCPEDIDRTQPVELLHTIPDCRIRDERIIHALFERYRVAGEWFEFSLPFLHHLAGLRYQTDRDRARHAVLVRAELKKAHLHGRAA